LIKFFPAEQIKVALIISSFLLITDFFLFSKFISFKKLETFFVDFRFKRVEQNEVKTKANLMRLMKSKISKKGYLQKLYENSRIKKYLAKLK